MVSGCSCMLKCQISIFENYRIRGYLPNFGYRCVVASLILVYIRYLNTNHSKISKTCLKHMLRKDQLDVQLKTKAGLQCI